MNRTRLVALAAAAALAALLVAPSISEARRNGRTAFTTDKQFGLGIMVGAPTGLAGKYYLGSKPIALAFGAGVLREFRHHEGTHLHVDVLWHPVVLATTESFSLPLYLGVGGRIWDHDDYYYDNRYYGNDTHVGVRFPLGLVMDFNNVPLDVFLEFVLVADVIVDHDYYDTLDFMGALGVRYYF